MSFNQAGSPGGNDLVTGFQPFVYNAQSQKVERRQIEESGLVGKDNVIITKGLKAGDQVVSAGATRLVEGQQVKVLTD